MSSRRLSPSGAVLALFLIPFAGMGLGVSCKEQGEERLGHNTEAIIVFAASSLTEIISEAANEWTRRTGHTVHTQFGATSTLARQLQQGAHADVFIPASPEWLDGVPVRERIDWLSNRLVLIVPMDAADPELDNLASLALANEQVPAGKYARAALTAMRFKLPERLIYGSSVRDVLLKVSQGGAQAGVVYATDAAIDSGVRVAFTFPEESHPPIVYTIALLHDRGRAYFTGLQEPWCTAIAVRQGFTLTQ